jgi:hypothetical protein
MKTYTFEVIIEEGDDEFWEEIGIKTGCDQVFEAISACLYDQGWSPKIRLVKFEG